jgi:hypothetical protein
MVRLICKLKRHVTAEIEEYDWIARKCVEPSCKRRYIGGGRITKVRNVLEGEAMMELSDLPETTTLIERYEFLVKRNSQLESENDELRDTIKGLRELAHDYIQAYEKLAFGDAN